MFVGLLGSMPRYANQSISFDPEQEHAFGYLPVLVADRMLGEFDISDQSSIRWVTPTP